MKLFQLAFEEENVSQSKQNTEIEVAVYAHISDMEGLKHAAEVIEQEQIEGEFHNGVRCRVRKETKGTETSYTFTYKVKQEGTEAVQSNKEYNIQVDQDFFEGFRNVAKKRLKKTRYVFFSKLVELTMVKEGGVKSVITLPTVKYEVDVYQKKDGTTSEWCKIDVELDAILPMIGKETEGKDTRIVVKVSHLPFKPVQPMLGSSQKPEEKDLMGKIWDNEWNLPAFDQPVEEKPVAQPQASQPMPSQGAEP